MTPSSNSSRNIIQAALFIALMAIAANLTAFITIGSVPLTFQTVIAILAGLLLGKKNGFFAMFGYLVLGLVGAPIFAGFTGGAQIFVSPTFGFLISFLFVAYISGMIAEKNIFSRSRVFIASLIGLAVNYLIGLSYLYFHFTAVLSLGHAEVMTIIAGMGVFLLKDLLLVVFLQSFAGRLIKATHKKASNEFNLTKTA